jgi:hypothetical protein
MLIQPVDSAQERFSRLASGNNRPADGNAFARIFAASIDKGNTAGGQTGKVAEAAEILRLEMMKSAVSFSGTEPEPATPTISNALKAFLTHY